MTDKKVRNLIPSCSTALIKCDTIEPIEGSPGFVKGTKINCNLNLNQIPGQKLMFRQPPKCELDGYKVTGNCCNGSFWKYQKTHHQDVIIPQQYISLDGII